MDDPSASPATRFAILHEDPQILVVDKPAGLSTTAPPIAPESLERMVRDYFRPDDPASAYVGLVHRLDRPVSGVLAIAKTPKVARRLSRQFADRLVAKEYWAIVEGRPPIRPDQTVAWDDHLCRDETGLGRVQVVSAATPRTQSARTLVTLGSEELASEIATPVGCSWIVMRPETGRTHQLRVQAASRGFPILGDVHYGATRPFRDGTIALMARGLTFRHPALDRLVTYNAPIPPTWRIEGSTIDGVRGP